MTERLTTFDHLFFDLDGTLTHPHEGITRCIRHALIEAGVEPPPEDQLRRFIGPPLRGSFAHLLGTTDPARLDMAMSSYRERFQSVGMFENAVCPGIREVLTELTARGCRLSVVTAKPAVFARRILDHFALTPLFDRVFGPDLTAKAYSKQSLIAEAISSTRADVHATAMIGDRAEDVLGARAHGLYAVGVTWGYGSRTELESARPDFLADAAADLLLAAPAPGRHRHDTRPL